MKIQRSWEKGFFTRKDAKRTNLFCDYGLGKLVQARELFAGLERERTMNPTLLGEQGDEYKSSSCAPYDGTIRGFEIEEVRVFFEWILKELNQVADDLTNEKCDMFTEDKRVKGVGGTPCGWCWIDLLQNQKNSSRNWKMRERENQIQASCKTIF